MAKKLNLGYEIPRVVKNGVLEYETPNDAYLGVVRDFLEEAAVVKRKGRLYLTLKPVLFRIRNLSNTMIMLPGSNYHDPIPWLFAELFDWLSGPLVAGGQAVLFDKHRRTVYPRANGEDDWSYKSAFGLKGGEGQLDWARRHLRMDASCRSCVISPWQVQRDLIKYTARKELEVNKAEEYQRLPCITSIQFTCDDTDEAMKKGLQAMVHQRALDFTGAAHCDIFRLAEVQHWLATTAIPNGFAGPLTVMAGTSVIESYGAGRFVEFGKLMEWWTTDERCQNINQYFVTNNICLDNPSLDYTPATKTYDFFYKEWQLTELIVYNCIKNQWAKMEERLANLKYGYYQDFCLAMACFEWMLMESMTPEVRAYHWDAKALLESINWGSNLGDYPPIHWLRRMDNWMAYYVAAELTRKFIAEQDWEALEQLFEVSDVIKYLQICLLMEASRFLGKRQLDKLWATGQYPEFQELHSSIFQAPEGEGG